MGRTLLLVKFNDGNVFISAYDCRSDTINPRLISEEDMMKKYGCIDFVEWDDDNPEHLNYKETEAITDSEDVEIFSDYGDGFSWRGKASKSKLYITSATYILPINWDDNVPRWAYDWMKEHGYNVSDIEDKVVDNIREGGYEDGDEY